LCGGGTLLSYQLSLMLAKKILVPLIVRVLAHALRIFPLPFPKRVFVYALHQARETFFKQL